MSSNNTKILAAYPFLADIIRMAEASINPHKIILFGSRARGDHRKTSDVDLAFFFDSDRGNAWPAFVLDVEEHAPTLLEFDLVDGNHCEEALQQAIAQEGIVIYAKS
jgi:predicted nucleotidyltransferase